MGFWKEHLSISEIERRLELQRVVTARFLTGEFGDGKESVEKYRQEMKVVETPLDLAALAAELKWPAK